MKIERIEQGKSYHIFNRGINYENIFLNDDNRKYFLYLYDKYLSDKLDTYAFCLLNNHFHLVIEVTEEAPSVSQALSNFFNAYVKAFNRATNRTGSLLHRPFRRILIKDENYLKELIIYVHLNPARHFDMDFRTYSFSSYVKYISGDTDKLLENRIVELFDSIENFKDAHIIRERSGKGGFQEFLGFDQ